MGGLLSENACVDVEIPFSASVCREVQGTHFWFELQDCDLFETLSRLRFSQVVVFTM